jgi:HEAT repeat protein
MSHSPEFANHFARLTSLFLRQTGEVDEQKQYLMAAVACANDLPVLLTREGDTLLADGAKLAHGTIYTMVLADRMKQHSLVRLEVMPSPSAADVLGLARILAAYPEGEGGMDLQQRLAAIRASTVRVEVAPTPKPAPAPEPPEPRVSFEAFEVVSEEEMQSSIARPAPKTHPTPTSSPGGMFAEMSGPKAGVTPAQLLKALENATDIGAVENILVAMPPHIAAALENGKSDEAVSIMQGIARRAARTTDPQTKKIIGQSIRRMFTSALLDAIVRQLPGAGDRLSDFAVLLSHGGDAAVERLADRLTESEVAKERRAIFNVLVQLKSGVPLFIHMLGDQRWFVVRNAADLLAQMAAPEAELPLLTALDSADVRARRSVVTALARYASPRAQGSVRRALQDAAPEVRLAAANGVGRVKSPEMTAALIDALGREQDPEVQVALLGALGRQGTDEAVRRLVEAAEPERLFKRKTPEYRVAAAKALRQAGTPAALQTLKELANDKEAAVREAATKTAR